MLFKKELTVTYSIEEVARIRGVLRENVISSSSVYADQLSARSERGYIPNESQRRTCSIYVRRKDYDRAQELLAQSKKG